MPKLSLKDAVQAMSTTSKLDKINLVLKSTNVLEDFLLTLSESFDFKEETITDLEQIVKGQLVDLDYSFMKQISTIKDQKDGFKGLMFCLKHYGFAEVNTAMKDLFGFQPEPYSSLINKLSNFNPRLPKFQKETEIMGPVLFQRVYAPSTITSMRRQPTALAVFTPSGEGKKRELISLILSGCEEIAPDQDYKLLEHWSPDVKGIWGGTVRQLRKLNPITVTNDGPARLVSFYES